MRITKIIKTVYDAIPIMIYCVLIASLYILLAPPSSVLAQEETDQETLDAIDEEIKWLQSETYVITPSKIPETIKKTAASITVVTDKQIRQMGAKDLNDVIWQVVPSFYSYNFFKDNIIFHQAYTACPNRDQMMMIAQRRYINPVF